MIERIKYIYETANNKMQRKLHFSVYESLILAGCLLSAILMLIRVFYGTELTDEAFYVSDAIAMLHGNVPYAYNNYSFGTGGVFLMIPFLFIYELIVPDYTGVFVYTRLCYMVFWYIILFLGYRILEKDFKKSSVLLAMGVMIVFAGLGSIYNFSYNTVPCAITWITGLFIYDAIEHKNKYSTVKFIVSGFLIGIAIIGNLAYGIVVLVFGILIFVRTKNVKEKLLNIGYCLIGGLFEMAVIFVPIIIQTSWSTLITGIFNKLHPYSTGKMSTISVIDKAIRVFNLYNQKLLFTIGIAVFVFSFASRYIRENEKRLSKKGYLLLGINVSILFLTLWFCRNQIYTNTDLVNWYWGFLGSIGIGALLVSMRFKKYPIILYLGLYPLIISLASIFVIDSNAIEWRFTEAVPSLVIYFIIMLNEEGELTKLLTTISIVCCIIAMGVNEFRYVYRDEHISNLDYRVESGVYKGIYTTQARAKDLPELEEYLNSIVGEDEIYAFRDNVPVAYLMMHKGLMCDKTTWDCLNYTYNKNAPANLYEFYTRRGIFPQKYIYVDFGRDKNLSCEDTNYKFNEFVNTYYQKVEDFKLNETFYHIVVYEYKGGFNGDFNYWIEKHKYNDELQG